MVEAQVNARTWRKPAVWRGVGVTVCLLLLAGIVAPYIRVDHYGSQIREALERGLNRKVEIGRVRFNLFTGPGFTIEDVVIYDDSSAGIEPFAHMLELDARVRLRALLAGRIEFARVRFIEPSINIVKPADQAWNVAPLLASTVAVSPAKSQSLPEIQVTDGRIFFKFGDTKSSFYFLNANVTIAPRSTEKGAVLIKFSGEPSSTNRAALGSGEFKASGRLITASGAASRLEMDLELEDGDVDDIIILLRGQSLGMHGHVGSTAKVWGPLTDLNVLGTMTFEDVHRWDLTPHSSGQTSFRYRGSLDFLSQKFVLQAKQSDNPGLPLESRVTIRNALSNPQWSAELTAAKLPAPALIESARRLGVPIPQEMNIRGNVSGMIAYMPETGMQGQLTIDAAKVNLPNGPELEVGQTWVLMNGDEVRLTPATLTGPDRAAVLEAVYSPTRHTFEASIRGESLRISELKTGGLIAAGATPLINQFSGGTWTGSVRYRSSPGSADLWGAQLDIRGTTTRVPGVADPVRIHSADVQLDGADVSMRRIRFTTGDVEATGSYSYQAATNQHSFDIVIPTASSASIERLLAPTLHPASRGGFLARTLNWNRTSVPEWIRTRKASGSVRIGTLSMGAVDVRQVRSRIIWTGTRLQLESLSGKVLGGALEGNANVEITALEPRYQFNGKLVGAAWRGGKVDLAGMLDTSGMGVATLLNLRTSGMFNARSLDTDEGFPIRTVSGDFGFSFSKLGPKLIVTDVEASVGSERFSGQGATEADGRLRVELASAGRVMHVSGPVSPLRLEVTADRLPPQPR